uniref:Uncharacterized protein n=1 Tax=Branchiostoma floridae TaxID=7739 RepID=C3ZGG7_BRAFL|eukprot:XP_002592337.1 hypothetical protein BRAFLDRAFT_101223 [Branchiostoma floridae]
MAAAKDHDPLRKNTFTIHGVIRNLILFGQLDQGTRPRGGQRKRYKDTLKHYLKKGHVDPTSLEKLCSDRNAWRQLTNTTVTTFETERVAAVEAKRKARKARQSRTATVNL